MSTDTNKDQKIVDETIKKGRNLCSDSEDLFAEYDDEMKNNDSHMEQNENKNVNSETNTMSDDSFFDSDQNQAARGAELFQLNSNLKLPPVALGSGTFKPKGKVFVKWPLVKKEEKLVVPQPFPERTIKDKWDEYHVRMPCSSQSQFPVLNSDGVKVLKNRWELIEQALSSSIANANEFEQKILSYNRSGRWNFDGIKERFADDEDPEYQMFFNKIVPEICALALRLPFVITQPIPLLRRGCNQSLTFSQNQIASLLANAFFCTFPRRNATGRQTEYSNFPIINFNRLFSEGDINSEKLSCLINYFRRVTEGQSPKALVTYTRRCLSDSQIPSWKLSEKRLPQLRITSTGTIEDDGGGMLQVDFANSYLGGGALGHGSVQEEIRFMICPELIASMLFTEQLDDLECLVISGHERFSDYKGYASSFQFNGNYVDPTELDTSFEQGHKRKSYLVAIDALYFRHESPQYNEQNITRELNKAFVGFHSEDESNRCTVPPVAVATGNWGCGAFGGDPHLKVLIQLMAAAECNRDIFYFTFGDEALRDNIFDMYSFLKRNDITVGKLFTILTGYSSILRSSSGRNRLNLYKYIKMQFDCSDQDTDDELSVDKSSNLKKVYDTSSNDNIKTSNENFSSDEIGSTNTSKPEKQPKLTDYFSKS